MYLAKMARTATCSGESTTAATRRDLALSVRALERLQVGTSELDLLDRLTVGKPVLPSSSPDEARVVQS